MCPTLCDPMDYRLPGPPSMGFSRWNTGVGCIENRISVVCPPGKTVVVVLTSSWLQSKCCFPAEVRGGVLTLKSVACEKTMPKEVTCLSEFNSANPLWLWTQRRNRVSIQKAKEATIKLSEGDQGKLSPSVSGSICWHNQMRFPSFSVPSSLTPSEKTQSRRRSNKT